MQRTLREHNCVIRGHADCISVTAPADRRTTRARAAWYASATHATTPAPPTSTTAARTVPVSLFIPSASPRRRPG